MAILKYTEPGPIQYFAVPIEHIPYKWYDINKSVDYGALFESHGEDEVVTLTKELLTYYSIAEFYVNCLNTVRDTIIKNQVFERFSKITEDFMSWQRENKDDVYKAFIPYELGEMLAERENYDDAIFVFQNSTGEVKKREEAIERCKYKRDGFIYDELKKAIMGLSERDQKQLIAFSKIFSLEFRLRKIVDKTISNKHNTKKWFEIETKPKLVGIKEKCKQRQKDYDNNYYDQDIAKQNSLIDFTTLSELETIIEDYWELFREKFKDKRQFFARLTIISPIRIDIAHARLIDDNKLAELSKRCNELDKVIGGESSEEQVVNTKLNKWKK